MQCSLRRARERLFEAYQDDGIPYIEWLGDHWGTLCASKEVASAWAVRLIDIVKLAWSPDPNLRGFFNGTTNCLSTLIAAERYDDVLSLLELAPYKRWHYGQYGVKALAAKGKKAEAIRYAEEGRGLIPPNPPVIWRRASARCGWEGSPGWCTRATAGCPSRNSAIACVPAFCAASRSGYVLIPRASSQASNGCSTGP